MLILYGYFHDMLNTICQVLHIKYKGLNRTVETFKAFKVYYMIQLLQLLTLMKIFK